MIINKQKYTTGHGCYGNIPVLYEKECVKTLHPGTSLYPLWALTQVGLK